MKRLTVTSQKNWAARPELVDFADAGAVIGDDLLMRLLDFWAARRTDGGLPARAAFDPFSLGSIMLPQIAVFECLERDGKPDVRYRLVGTALVDRLGLDATGTYMRDSVADPVHAEQLIRHTHLPIETGSPVFSHGFYVDPADGQTLQTTKRLTLPLRPMADGTRVAIAGQVIDSDLSYPPTANEVAPVYHSNRFVRFLMPGQSPGRGRRSPAPARP